MALPPYTAPMPAPTSQPLTPDDVEMLRRVDLAARTPAAGLAVLAVLLAGCALVFVVIGRLAGAPPGLALAMNAAALVTLLLGVWLFTHRTRIDRRLAQATREALAKNSKFTVAGTVDHVAALPGGALRYTVDGQFHVDVVPVLGLDAPRSHATGRPLTAVRHLAQAPVEIECVARDNAVHLLLRTRYPMARQAMRTERPATSRDRRRAGRSDRRFMGVVLAGGAVLAIGTAWADGFRPGFGLFMAGYAAAICALVFVVGVLPQLLRARRFTHLHTVSGPVTEILTAQVPQGKHTAEVHWFRVDGQLFGALDLKTDAQLGNQVTVEFLGNARAADGGRVVSLQRSATAPPA